MSEWRGKYRINRKGTKQSNKGGGDLSPIGKAIIGGLFLYVLAQMGLGAISDKISEAKDKVDQVKEVKEVMQSETQHNIPSKQGTQLEVAITIDADIDIDADTVKNILEKIEDNLPTTNTDNTTTIVIDYSALDNSNTYTENVLNQLSELSSYDAVTFLFVKDNITSQDDMQTEFDRVSTIVNTNINVSNTSFNSVKLNGAMNSPRDNSLSVAITFY